MFRSSFPPKLDFLRVLLLAKTNKQFPDLAVAANKLLPAHTKSCYIEYY